MVYKLQDEKKGLISESYDDGMLKLNEFFEKDWKMNTPRLFVVKDRKMINGLMGWDTPGWLVAWGGKPKDETAYAYILDKDNYEKESIKEYSEDKYRSMILHELTHCFIDSMTETYRKPAWLNEGISEYLADQLQWKKKIPDRFVEFLESFDEAQKGAYLEGGFVVKMLVEKYGKEKLLDLLGRIKDERPDENGFTKLFGDMYGIELSYDGINDLWLKFKKKHFQK